MIKQRGSAILIAIFLIAAVGSVAFGIGRMFLAESAISNIYESSTIAYYAAESGIEEGFLRYRYDKNTIVPSNKDVSTNDLTNLTQNNDTLDNFYRSITDSTRYYALSMQYKQKFYGADVNAPNPSNPTLDKNDVADPNYPKEYSVARDEAIKIDITDAAASDVDFYAKITDDSSYTGKPFIEVKLIGQTPLGFKEMKAALVKNTEISSFANGSYVAMADLFGISVYQVSRLVDAIKQTTSSPLFDSGTKVELYLKPVGCSVQIGLKPLSTPPLIAGPFSTVKSTGYYGGVTRTLEARIDRQAGTVYDLFDFVLYKKPI